MAVIVMLVVVEVGLSIPWPHVVPRLAFLPQPAERDWYDGCNWHHRYYERSGFIWMVAEDNTVRACIP